MMDSLDLIPINDNVATSPHPQEAPSAGCAEGGHT